MHPELVRALDPVQRDIAITRAPSPIVVDDEWDAESGRASAMLLAPGGSGAGISIQPGSAEADQIATVAEQVQAWVIEEFWGRNSNWPPCPRHPATHPMMAEVVDGTAVWRCPRDPTPTCLVGELPTSP